MMQARGDPFELQRIRLERGLIASSGKMVLMDKLLPKLRREGHKVLIFSQVRRPAPPPADDETGCYFRA